MFVYSFRASTAKFLAVVAVALTTLVLLVVFVPSYSVSDSAVSETAVYRYTGIRSDGDRREFLGQFGWEVADAVVEEREVTVPSEFDKVFAAYNELQKEQGFDLSRYKKKTVMRYTYEITNFEGYDGTVYANLIVYRGRVIGADLTSKELDGFVCGLEGK